MTFNIYNIPFINHLCKQKSMRKIDHQARMRSVDPLGCSPHIILPAVKARVIHKIEPILNRSRISVKISLRIGNTHKYSR